MPNGATSCCSDSIQPSRPNFAAVGDVQLEDQQVVRLSHSLGYGAQVPAGGHDRVAGGQGGLGEIDTHATAGTSNEPNLLVSLASHGTSWIRVPRLCLEANRNGTVILLQFPLDLPECAIGCWTRSRRPRPPVGGKC